MGRFILRGILFAADRVRMICLALALVVVLKSLGLAVMDRLQPSADAAMPIAQPS